MTAAELRDEVVAALLALAWDQWSQLGVSAAPAQREERAVDPEAQRNVREGLAQLVEAGVVDVVEISDDRYYSVRHTDWASLLGMPAAPDLPFHYDWIPTYRTLTRIVRWLQQPGLDDLTPYLRASQARTLVDTIAVDLRYAGIPVAVYAALGVDFWDEFAEIVRATIRAARGQR